jgi:hypothetical protein
MFAPSRAQKLTYCETPQVKGIIESELKEKLESEKYHVDKAAKQAKEITDGVKKKLKGGRWHA